MGICKRAVLSLVRKKGKAILLFLIFFLVSALLLTCFSILDGTRQAARDLRTKIGAVFYIRPYTQMTMENGTVSEGSTPIISRQSMEEVTAIIGEELRAYNTEQYGYAKSDQLRLLPGAGDSEASNMGQVTAVRYSKLTDVFLSEEYTLLAGRHIEPQDENKILISAELAAENDLEIGDVIPLTHAGLDQQDGLYIDTIPEKTAFVKAEVVGIFQCTNSQDSPDAPTAGKSVNHIFSDSHLLVNLQEQQDGIYEGELAFYISDPLELNHLLEQVKAVDSIDWKNHILRENDFQYEQIAGQLQRMQNTALSLIVIAAVLSIAALMLILMIRMRSRIHEIGIYLSVGKSKTEILGQLALENWLVLTSGFCLALLLSVLCSELLNQSLFGILTEATEIAALQTGGKSDYLKPEFLRSVLLFFGESCAVLLTVLASGMMTLALKSKELLTKMS